MKYLITGGTGSFGNAMLRRLLPLSSTAFSSTNIDEIRIFSRDEKKQDDMKHIYTDPRITYILGDVRNYEDVLFASRDIDYIFSAAALKQVPSCEEQPMQAIRTNILGSANVMQAAQENKVKSVVMLSTDKAVMPVNVMGMTKALMEKLTKSYSSKDTVICATRYGNVMASRGSVIPLFIDQIKKNTQLTITVPEMTRFMMSLEDAVNLVLHAHKVGTSGETFVMKSPAATIMDLATELLNIFEMPPNFYKIVGIRPGEKIHETLVSEEETARAIDGESYIRILPYGVSSEITRAEAYTSENTERIWGEKLRDLLLGCPYVQKELEAWRK